MPDEPSTVEEAGHEHFAAAAFHRAWELIDQADRSADDVGEMVDAAHASAWHWRYRPDRTPKTDAVAAWQLSRVYALAGDAEQAARYGRRSLDIATGADLGPFYIGYGHEALARAAAVARNAGEAQRHVTAGRAAAAEVSDADDRRLLEADLSGL